MTSEPRLEVPTVAQPTEETSDGELVGLLARGDPAALAVLYRRYAAVVRAVIWARGGVESEADVEDIVQEVFLEVLAGRAKSCRAPDRLRSFICGIAVFKCRNLARKRRVRRAFLDRVGFGSRRERAAEVDPVSYHGMRLTLAQALGRLPSKQRDVLVLHHVAGLSGEEMATALGVPSNTVWTRLFRARQRMRELMTEESP